MGLKLRPILAFILVGLTPMIYGAAAGPVPKASILQDILTAIKNNNTELCPTPKEILESKFVKICDNFSFPTSNMDLVGNHNIFLCLALYDRAFQICHYGSFGTKFQNVNRSAFDAMISGNMAQDVQLDQVCSSFSNPPAALLNKTAPFVDVLMGALKQIRHCRNICYEESNDGANPLCFVISTIDKVIKDETNEHSNKPKEPAKVNDEPKDKVNSQQKLKAVTETIEAAAEKPQIDKSPSGIDGKSVPVQAPPKVDPKISNGKKGEKKAGKETKSKSGSKEREKEHSTQGQPPPGPKLQEKNDQVPKGEVEGEANAPSQIAPPAKADPGKDAEPKDDDKATVSPNTGDTDTVSFFSNDGNDGVGVDAGNFAEADPADGNSFKETNEKIGEEKETVAHNVSPKLTPVVPEDESHFFGYFTIFGLFGIGLFAAYHHKHKIFAMLLEGRRSRGARGRRRPSTANYRKLDANLEEAVTSQCSANVTHVIY